MMLTVAYFAHKNGWGGDVTFEWPKLLKALLETLVVIAWPLVIWLMVTEVGTHAQLTVLVGLVLLFTADKLFNFQAVLPIMTPVLLIGGGGFQKTTDKQHEQIGQQQKLPRLVCHAQNPLANGGCHAGGSQQPTKNTGSCHDEEYRGGGLDSV